MNWHFISLFPAICSDVDKIPGLMAALQIRQWPPKTQGNHSTPFPAMLKQALPITFVT
jgi:hypothetical protein